MTITNVIDDEGAPVEIGPGRGDLRQSSMPFVLNLRRNVKLVGRHVSYARLFAEQGMVAGIAGWLLRQSTRVPLKVYRRVDEDSRVRLGPSDHPLAAAIETPWERGSRVNLIQALLGPYLTHGNSITELVSGAKESIAFAPADWRFAWPIMPWRNVIAGWELDRDTPLERRTRGAEQVLHIATWSPLGPIGISPLEQLGVTIAIEDAAQRHQRQSLANGVRSTLALKMSESFIGLDKETRQQIEDNLRDDIGDIYAGPDNSGRPLLLPPGLEPQIAGQTAIEADLIEQRKVDRAEALAVYGVTPGAIGVVEGAGADLEIQRQMAYTDGLAPPLIVIEQSINAQLVRGLLAESDVFVEFDFAGILRGDKLKEIEALRQAISSALMSPNEGRSVLNLPTSESEGMDEFYLPRNNLIPVAVPYVPKGQPLGEYGNKDADEAIPPAEDKTPGDPQDEPESHLPPITPALSGRLRD